MARAHPSRTYGIVAASLAGHAILVTLLVLHAPRLQIPEPPSGPPEAVIPVLILPRTPPPAAQPGAKPTPVRLHRRPQRFSDQHLPVAPLITPLPEATAERPAAQPGPRVLTLPSSQDALAVNARNALRSRLGCDSPSLSRAERESCLERFAAGAGDAPVLGLGMDRDKAAELARAAARREAGYNYRRDISPPAPASSGVEWDTTRSPPGQSEALGKVLGDDRPTAKVPF